MPPARSFSACNAHHHKGQCHYTHIILQLRLLHTSSLQPNDHTLMSLIKRACLEIAYFRDTSSHMMRPLAKLQSTERFAYVLQLSSSQRCRHVHLYVFNAVSTSLHSEAQTVNCSRHGNHT